MRLNGSQMLVEALHLENVRVIFGYPGGAVLNIYDELYKQTYFEHILTRHEQAAIHAADGYARASGEVGVAIITSGPGFTNAVTGIATAYMDSIPLVVISGQVPVAQIGTDAFQEIDAVGISRPCTKHNFLVKDIADLPRIIKEAFYIARSGRCGPVLIDLPKDISANIGDFHYPESVDLPSYKPTYEPDLHHVAELMRALSSSSRPLAYLGGGVIASGASDLVRELLQRAGIPAVETLMARGALDSRDGINLGGINLGMVGMHGSYAANMAMCECDLLLCFGARFDDRVTGKVSEFAKHAKIAHIDIDPSSIGKIIDVDYSIIGDVRAVCEMMIGMLERDSAVSSRFSSWRDHLAGYQELHPLGYEHSAESIKPQWVIEQLGALLGDSAIIATDVGQHQMWAAQFYPFASPRRFLTSGGLGTMGFGFPAAMGAYFAHRDKHIINITGDGSILMNIQELMTCVACEIPVVNVILNNNYLGMVRQWQSFFYESRFSHTDLSMQPDFVALAASFGGLGFRVEHRDDVVPTLEKALESKRVCLVDIAVDRYESVLPMVPGGAALDKMILKS